LVLIDCTAIHERGHLERKNAAAFTLQQKHSHCAQLILRSLSIAQRKLALALIYANGRRSMMLKHYLNFALAALMVFGAIAPTALAAPKGQQLTTQEVKTKVLKLGTGSKAKATVWLADGRKVKGYVSQAGDEDFVMRDRQTDAATTVRYADVVKFERNNGHSTAKWVGIGAGVGVGAFVVILLSIFASLND
jgi:hypothetical protein